MLSTQYSDRHRCTTLHIPSYQGRSLTMLLVEGGSTDCIHEWIKILTLHALTPKSWCIYTLRKNSLLVHGIAAQMMTCTIILKLYRKCTLSSLPTCPMSHTFTTILASCVTEGDCPSELLRWWWWWWCSMQSREHNQPSNVAILFRLMAITELEACRTTLKQ